MKLKDILTLKHKDKELSKMIYIASTKTQHLFSKPESIVELSDGEVGVIEFTPINKKHNFVQVEENTWELDMEPIDKNDL
jgi:hypothetical protein